MTDTSETRQAAESMGKILEAHGHQCRVHSVKNFEPEEVKQARLICIGPRVKDPCIIKHQTTESIMQFIEEMGKLDGKQMVVFYTYMLADKFSLRQLLDGLVPRNLIRGSH